MQFQLETNVPIPPVRKDTVMYPFHMMEVGHSFIVKKERVARTATMAYAYARKHKVKFTIRKLDDGTGSRIWRTA